MTMKAKPVLKDKFWIVEEEGLRVGTLSKNDDGFVVSQKGSIEFYKSENHLKKTFGKNFLVANITNKETVSSREVHGYPTRTTPYNSMYDIKNKLPLFTKSKKSKSLYAAGYYIIKFNKGWVRSFCPKLVTLESYEYKGPFKTEFTMRQELSNANKRSN